MFTNILQQIKTAFLLLVIMTVLTGLIYPMLVTLLAQQMFPYEANGELIERNGKIIGSELIGQNFTAPEYFWGRPSATTPYPYNAENSSGSNLGPSNPDLMTAVNKRIDTLKKADPKNDLPVPVDLVTASGSGLDPEISPEAAYYQASRVAAARNMSLQDVQNLIQQYVNDRTFGILGEPRVNVLALNIALDSLMNPPLEEFMKTQTRQPAGQ